MTNTGHKFVNTLDIIYLNHCHFNGKNSDHWVNHFCYFSYLKLDSTFSFVER